MNLAVRSLAEQEPASAPPAKAGAASAASIRGLCFGVDDRRGGRTEILSDVDLTLADREFVSIVGPSGCGKSTLLNFVAGLLPVQTGRVEVFGAAPGQGPGVGYMFQQHGLLPWRSIVENVELGLEIAGVGRRERRDRARSMLSELGLSGFDDHFPNELSGGMRQRASMARTLIADPRLILMDEPFGALDAQTKIFMQELFLRYWDEHRKTVLFVTHDLSEAIALSDRVLVMSARPGHVIADYRVCLDRPRDFDRLRSQPEFNSLYAQIWADIRRESAVSMRGRSQ